MEHFLDKIPEIFKMDLERAIQILKSEGCKEVFLFGSLAEGTQTANSDIDLAVQGCPPDKFFHLLGKLLIELVHPVDLSSLNNGKI